MAGVEPLSEQLWTRVTRRQRDRLELAAIIAGETVAEFLRKAMLSRLQAIQRRAPRIHGSGAQAGAPHAEA